jgi:hypothetical protein
LIIFIPPQIKRGLTLCIIYPYSENSNHFCPLSQNS